MAKDDYEVIAYKVLAYYYACLKEGVKGNLAKAKELVGCNDMYFSVVLNEMSNQGYLVGSMMRDMNGDIIHADLTITLAGTEFISNNSTMSKVKATLGKAFELVLATAVQATALL